jgi:predicted CXXCH cytochrome family protein
MSQSGARRVPSVSNRVSIPHQPAPPRTGPHRPGCRPTLWHRVVLALLLLLAAMHDAGSAPVDSKYDKTCTSLECHPATEADRYTISHPPFLEEWCDRCHTDHTGTNPKLIKASEPGLCLQCHTKIETREGTLQHPPGGQSCTACHNPHRASVRHLLKDENLRLECSKCHEEDLKKAGERPFHHKFFDPKTECGSCHNAHQGKDTKYLRENVGESCLTCHDMPIQVEGRKLENVGKEILESPVIHPPLKEAACPECHTPHGSMQSSLLSDNYPSGAYEKYQRENYGLCWKCHDSALVEASQTTTATKFRNGDVNLHQVHVQKFKRGRACHLCHTPHAAERPHLLRETIKFASWDGKFDFLQTADGGNCTVACHRPKEYRR